MSLLESSEKIIQTICEKTGKTLEEINGLVEKKKARFAGLLTDSGAAFMIAKELGIDLEAKDNLPAGLKVSRLEEGMRGFLLKTRVLQVFAPNRFEKDGKKGVYVRLLVGDESGEIPFTLWHGDVSRVQEEVKRNSVLELRECFVSSFNGKKQLGLGRGGSWTVIDGNQEGLGKPRQLQARLGELKPEMREVDVVARLARVFDERVFEKDGKKGTVMNFELGDETALVRGVAWNEMVKEIKRFAVGEVVGIEGAYCKKGLNGMELHLSWRSRIARNPSTLHKIPSLGELLGKEFKRTGLDGIVPGMADVETRATIVDLVNRKPYYLVCDKCGGKIESLENGFVCNKCGEVKDPKPRAIASVLIDDGKRVMRAVAFGGTAEKILGIGAKELKETGLEKLLPELKKKVVGKEFLFRGKAKQGWGQETELMVESIGKVDAGKEAKVLLESENN